MFHFVPWALAILLVFLSKLVKPIHWKGTKESNIQFCIQLLIYTVGFLLMVFANYSLYILGCSPTCFFLSLSALNIYTLFKLLHNVFIFWKRSCFDRCIITECRNHRDFMQLYFYRNYYYKHNWKESRKHINPYRCQDRFGFGMWFISDYQGKNQSGRNRTTKESIVDESTLWSVIVSHAGETFYTTGRGHTPGKPFTYSIRGSEMFISVKAK